MGTSDRDPALGTWGRAGARLLRTMRLEASRSSHAEVMPQHLLLAALDQPEMYQALRAAGRFPDVYAIRRTVAAASLRPAEYTDDTPLSSAVEDLLCSIRARREQDEASLLYLLALKMALANQLCRTLLSAGGTDPRPLADVLARIA